MWFEKPWYKKTRQLYAGQYNDVLQTRNLPSEYLKQFNLKPNHYVDHHLSHASAAYFTSPYEECIGVMIDAIGEWDTTTIWHIRTHNGETQFKKLWNREYPHSLGLWYSAMTQRLGLKPQEDEYILMGMAGWGTLEKELQSEIRKDFFGEDAVTFTHNLHRG